MGKMLTSRISRRFKRDLKVVRLLDNWWDALKAEVTRSPLPSVRLRNGVTIRGPETLDLAFLFHEIWVEEVYRYPGFNLRPGDVVIDIGANIGVFATYAATRAPGVRVLSFEPFPGNVSWLQSNLRESHLSNVHVFQNAVAGCPGRQYLQVNPSNWIVHSLVHTEVGSETLLVECVTLDEVMKTNELSRCDMLKLDCEGSEYDILRGCSPQTLARVKHIVGEFHRDHRQGNKVDELCQFLRSRSFKIERFEPADGGVFLCAVNTGI